MEPTELEWVWLTGLYEGEGTIYFLSSPSTPGRSATGQLRLQIAMTDRDIIERLPPLWGGKVTEVNRKTAGRKTRYDWRLWSPSTILPVVEGMWPRLGERRREQALTTLQKYNMFQSIVRGSPEKVLDLSRMM